MLMVFIPSKCPPVMRLSQTIFSQALIASSLELIFKPVNFSASAIFGVVKMEFGSRYLFNAFAMSCWVKSPPDVATMTGSTTAFKSYSLIFLETNLIISGEYNIPVFINSTSYESITASICSVM